MWKTQNVTFKGWASHIFVYRNVSVCIRMNLSAVLVLFYIETHSVKIMYCIFVTLRNYFSIFAPLFLVLWPKQVQFLFLEAVQPLLWFPCWIFLVSLFLHSALSSLCLLIPPALWPPLLLYIPVSHPSLQPSHTQTDTHTHSHKHTHTHTAALAPIIFKHFSGTRPSQHPLLIAHKCYPNQIRLIKNICKAARMLSP